MNHALADPREEQLWPLRRSGSRPFLDTALCKANLVRTELYRAQTDPATLASQKTQ